MILSLLQVGAEIFHNKLGGIDSLVEEEFKIIYAIFSAQMTKKRSRVYHIFLRQVNEYK